MHASNRVYIPLQYGVYIRSIFLEGAGWDKRNSVLVEPAPMQLVCNMPVIHFRPTEQFKKRSRGNDADVEITREKLFVTFKRKKKTPLLFSMTIGKDHTLLISLAKDNFY